MLTAQDLSYAYGAKSVLNRAALSIAPGEIVGLGGPSGAGKSTLGRILAGQFAPDTGRVLLDAAPLPRFRSGTPSPVQYAPQSAELAVDPRWTVRRVLENAGHADSDTLAVFGIREAWLDRHPAQLSGGELARVSLARLFHPGLRFIVCDEITSSLDALEQDWLLMGLRDLARRRNLGVLLISHSRAVRRRYCDRDLHLIAGQLKPVDDGTVPGVQTSPHQTV